MLLNRRVRRCAGLFAASFLASCAFNSGIVQIGPDTYALSEMRAPALGGGPEAQRALLAESGAFCRQQDRVALTLSLQPDGDPYTPYFPTAFDATFRCVPPAPAS